MGYYSFVFVHLGNKWHFKCNLQLFKIFCCKKWRLDNVMKNYSYFCHLIPETIFSFERIIRRSVILLIRRRLRLQFQFFHRKFKSVCVVRRWNSCSSNLQFQSSNTLLNITYRIYSGNFGQILAKIFSFRLILGSNNFLFEPLFIGYMHVICRYRWNLKKVNFGQFFDLFFQFDLYAGRHIREYIR